MPQESKGYERRNVSFPSCGTTLKGHLFAPANAAGPRPAIVLTPGFSAVKEGSVSRYAAVFAEAGFVALAYDNINLGESGGEPRQEVDWVLQRRGYRDAISFLRTTCAEVDGDRIGIWGSSFSGANVLEVAAVDRRVKCVVSQVPGISGHQSYLRRVPASQAAAHNARLIADREARFLGKPPAMIAAVSSDPATPCVMPGMDAYEYFMKQAAAAPNWKNEVTLQSSDLARAHEAGLFVPRISPTPLMMIVSLTDALSPPDLVLDAYERALQPKQLVMLPGGHFTPYYEEFENTSTAARDWFAAHLRLETALRG